MRRCKASTSSASLRSAPSPHRGRHERYNKRRRGRKTSPLRISAGLRCPLEIGTQDDGSGCLPLHAAVLAPGAGEHIAHQNQTDGQSCQQKQRQQADLTAVGCHSQNKQCQHSDQFHSLSVLLHNHDLQSNVCFLDGYTIAHLFDDCKQLFAKISTKFRFSFCETYGKL